MNTFHDPLVALHDLTLGLMTEKNPDTLLNTILDQAIEYTKSDSGSIALLDENRQSLEIKVFRGLAGDTPEKVKLKLGEGVTGRCILTGRIRNVGDTSVDPYYVAVRSDIQSELAIPLNAGNKSFGVLSVDSSRKNAFTQEHEEYLSLLASYAAQIFKNQESIRHISHRQYIQDILIEISGFLGQTPNFENVFEETIHLLEDKIGVRRAAVYLEEETSKELAIVYSLNYTEEEKVKSRYKPGEGVTGGVFRSSKPMAIADISSDQAFLNKAGIKQPEKKISFLSTPILVNHKPAGVFNMEVPYTTRSKFDDYTFLIQLIATLFSQAISIHNLILEQKKEIEDENVLLKRQFDSSFSFDNIAGKSPAIQNLFKIMQMAADSPSAILIVGESGTGKELIASAIHNNSVRKNNKLIKINCAAIPSDLLESELFGYAKGAFTGAEKEHAGKFLAAHNGTLFLDEIGEMDYKLQSKLLRFLQEKEFSPLGSNTVHKVDVRILAATNANLESMIKEKTFREDLYYRLNVIRIDIPPLRDRMEDLPFLGEHLLQKIAKKNSKPYKKLSEPAFRKLEQYRFPGNIRELENILERAFVLSSGTQIQDDDIVIASMKMGDTAPQPGELAGEREEKQAPLAQTMPESAEPAFQLKSWIKNIVSHSSAGDYHKDVIRLVEAQLIDMVLKKALYNKSKAARLLGMNRLTLDKKIKELKMLDDEESL